MFIHIKYQMQVLTLVTLLLAAHQTLAQKPELVVQTGHLHTVRAVAISNDGKLIASAGADKLIILWDIKTEKQLISLRGHTGWIFGLAFSPDGHFLASGSSDGTVVLWNILEGRKEYDIPLQPYGVTSVAFSPGGDTLAISTTDEVIRLWEMKTRKLTELRGHTGQVTQVAFSPDGNHLASSSADGTIRIWNLAKWEQEFQITYKEKDSLTFRMSDFKNPVDFVRDMRQVKDPMSDYLRSQFDVSTLRLLKNYDGSIPLPEPLQNALVAEINKLLKGNSLFAPDRFKLDDLEDETKKLLAQNPRGDDLVRLNRLLLGEAYPFAIARKQDKVVTSLAYSPDGNLLAFGAADNNIGVLDTQAREVKLNVPPYGYHQVVSGDEFDIRRVQLVFRLGGNMYPAGSLTFTSNNELAFVDGLVLRVLDVETGKEKLSRETTSYDGSFAVATGKDRGLLVYNDGQSIKLLDLASKEIKELKGGFEAVDAVMFSKKGKSLAAWVGGVPKTWGDDFEASQPSLDSILAALVSSINVYIPSVNMIAHIEPPSSEDASPDIKLLDHTKPDGDLYLKGHSKNVTSIAISPDGNIFASSGEDGIVIIWDVKNRTPKKVLQWQARRIAFSPDGRFLVAAGKDGIKLWDVKTWEAKSIKNDGNIREILFSPNSKVLAVNSGELGGTLTLWEIETSKHLHTFKHDATPEEAAGRGTLYGNEIFTSTLIGDIKDYETASGPMAFSPDSRFVACQEVNFATSTYRIKIWDVKTGEEARVLAGHSQSIRSIAFSPNGKILVSGSWDGTIKLWNPTTGEELATLVPLNSAEKSDPFEEGNWVIFTPEGRFDTNINIDEVKNLNWVIPGDALHPLPLSIFMRDYYEPKLLQRILTGEKFRPVRDISTLNRTQPQVEIKEVRPDGVDTVQVELDVANVVSQSQHDAQGQALQSGVFDVRLFRDGQMVASSTEEGVLTDYVKAAGEMEQAAGREQAGLALWCKAHRVALETDGHARLTFHQVKLPQAGSVKEVEFSAYAFNNDRVKSDTAHYRYKTPPPGQPRKGRAYVIAVGVNAYENPAFDLSFAANDARRMLATVTRRLQATGEYEEVVPVSLISDWERDGDRVKVTRAQATKEDFKTVLRLLTDKAGEVSPARRSLIANADRLRPATPDDTVLILFSSHGYADRNGLFYLIPYDTGPGTAKEFTSGVRQHSISSDELSLWLRDVDAGQIALIVDACHSAAAVEGSEFKPGPMGSRGLGQLSYDKGMRILTATQSDNVALEVCHIGGQSIKQGLLTYALIKDGLEDDQADFSPRDNNIFLSEWLEFGTLRVPDLVQEVLSDNTRDKRTGCDGSPKLVGRGVIDEAEDGIQRPVLFDFTRRGKDTIIARKP